jgi:hypothetical protein
MSSKKPKPSVMNPHPLGKASILMLAIVIIFIGAWEYYWRSLGFSATYNDDKVLWSSKRKEIYKAPEEATVFIGGSRIKFDLDIPTWETLTGEKVVQLAIVGTPGRPILHDLANDKNFKGKLIIDVCDPQFFSLDSMRREESAREALDYYNNETPAQRASALINYQLESRFAFLEEGGFSLNPLLNEIPLPPRPDVFVFPLFAKGFGLTTADRQTFMTTEFLTDTALQNIQKRVWTMLMVGGMKRFPALGGADLDAFLAQIKKSVDKIKARGGQVVFVRPPSSGILLEVERQTYPRAQYWDRVLTYTNTPGIHFEDYPEVAHIECPEMSHVSSEDAVAYTKHLVQVLSNEKGWKFPRATASVSQ